MAKSEINNRNDAPSEHKLIFAKPVYHIFCHCGYEGNTSEGECPKCHAREVMTPQERADHHGMSVEELTGVPAESSENASTPSKSQPSKPSFLGGGK